MIIFIILHTSTVGYTSSSYDPNWRQTTDHHYEASESEPPKRPPTPSLIELNEIDNWEKQMNADLNYIYQSLERNKSASKQQKPLQKSLTTSNMTTSRESPSFLGVDYGSGSKSGAFGKYQSDTQNRYSNDYTNGYHTDNTSQKSYQYEPYSASTYNREKIVYDHESPASSIEANFYHPHSTSTGNTIKRSSSWIDRSEPQRFVRNINYDNLGSDSGTYKTRTDSHVSWIHGEDDNCNHNKQSSDQDSEEIERLIRQIENDADFDSQLNAIRRLHDKNKTSAGEVNKFAAMKPVCNKKSIFVVNRSYLMANPVEK